MSDLSVRVISKSDAKELHELAYAVITTENVSVWCLCPSVVSRERGLL